MRFGKEVQELLHAQTSVVQKARTPGVKPAECCNAPEFFLGDPYHLSSSTLLHLKFGVVDLAKDPPGKRIFSKIQYALRLSTLILSRHKAQVQMRFHADATPVGLRVSILRSKREYRCRIRLLGRLKRVDDGMKPRPLSAIQRPRHLENVWPDPEQ